MLNVRTKILMILTVGFLSCSTAKKEEENTSAVQTAVQQNELPNLTIVSDEQRLSVRDLAGKKLILILFQSSCDHCQAEGQQIRENIKAFEKYTLYFVSADASNQIKNYAENLGLDKIENVHFASTDVQQILDIFGPIQAPSVYIYSDKGKLIKSFVGQTDIDNIIKAL